MKRFSKCLLELSGRMDTPVWCPRCRRSLNTDWSVGEVRGIGLNYPCRGCGFALGFWHDKTSAPHFRTVHRA